MQDKILSMLGLATKGRNVVSGEFSSEKSVKSGSAALVIVAEDASNNTKKMFANMCEFYKVPNFVYGTKVELGHAMGKELRSSLAVTDGGFAKSIIKQLEEKVKDNLSHENNTEVVKNGEIESI